MRRFSILFLVAALAAACGGGAEPADDDGATSTTAAAPRGDEATDTTADPATTVTAAPEPKEFLLDEEDNGAIVRVQPGDAVIMRLPVEDPADPQWVIVREPDPAILQIVDSLLWTPSDPGAGEVSFEFSFFVVGTGETDVTFSLGPPTPTSR